MMDKRPMDMRYVLRQSFSFLLIISLCMIFASCTDNSPSTNDVSVSVNSDEFSYSNSRQDCMGIKMQAIDGRLYIYMPRPDAHIEPSIFVFEKNGVSEMENVLITNWYKSLWNDQLVGFENGYMYIERHPAKATESAYPQKAELICYDLATGDMTTLLCTEDAPSLDTSFDENGVFYASIRENTSEKEKQYQAIQGSQLLDHVVSKPDLRSGTVAEVLEAYNGHTKILSESQLEHTLASVQALGIKNSTCTLYPCVSGWMIHIDRCSVPLWLVSFDGTVSKVFEFESMTTSSSFNIYGDQAYLSFKRYEKWDDHMNYFLQPYANDTISGTYRIDLTDFTMTKVSADSYRGIFIFDDTSILTVDINYGVYQLDPNGCLVNTLINPKESR